MKNVKEENFMKTVVTIVGVGERRTGTGKNGKKYDIANVAFTYPDTRMEGVNAGNCVINGADLDTYSIYPGVEVNALIMYRNYQPYIAHIF